MKENIQRLVTEIRFAGKVSKMGDKFIVVIPQEFHKDIKPLRGKQVAVSIRDLFQ